MKKKTKIVLVISAAILLVLILAAIELLFFQDLRQWFWMEIHDESRLTSFLTNIEDNSVVEFPEKIESLKAAERVYTEREGSYVFVLRFKTDKKGFTQLRESLSQLGTFSGYDVQPGENADDHDLRILFKSKHTPEWYNEELPEGALYTSHGTANYYLESRKGKLMHITCTCVTLTGSEEVVVYMAGDGFYSMKDYGD